MDEQTHTTLEPITEAQLLECLTLGPLDDDEMLEGDRAMLLDLDRRGLVKRVWVLT